LHWPFFHRNTGRFRSGTVAAITSVRLAVFAGIGNEAHRLLQNDIDPGLHKKMVKLKLREQTENSLQAIAMEWYTKFRHTWTEGHSCSYLEAKLQQLAERLFQLRIHSWGFYHPNTASPQ